MRRALLVLALALGAVVAGLGVLLFGGGEPAAPTLRPALDGAPAEPGAGPSAAVRASAEPREEGAAARAGTGGSGRSAAVEGTEPREREGGARSPGRAAAAEDLVAVRGRALVTDEQDVVRAEESGTLWLALAASGLAPRAVSVREGEWTAELPRGGWVSPVALELGGRPAFVESGAWQVPAAAETANGANSANDANDANGGNDGNDAGVASDARGAVQAPDVEARWARAVTLRVVEAGSGRDLDGLEVVLGRRDDPRAAAADPPGARRLADARSPLVLPPPARLERRAERVWARADGHAWGALEVDHLSGGERLLELPRAAALTVELTGADPPPGAMLRVRPLEPMGASERVVPGAPVGGTPAARGGELALADLAPGAYALVVESDAAPRAERELARRDVELAPGARLRERLELAAPEHDGRVPLEGTLVLPAAWNAAGARLRVALVTAPLGSAVADLPLADMEELGGDRWAWSAGSVEPGRYVLEVFPLSVRAAVEVGPRGERAARVEVPPPADVRVRVVDAATGALAAVERLAWRGELPEGVSRYLPGAVYPEPATGEFAFRAPQGEVTITTIGGTYRRGQARAVLFPGENRVTIEVEPACGIELVLKDGDAVLPFDPRRPVDLRAAEPGGGRRIATHEGRIEVSKPGRYRLKVGPIAGFETPPEREVPVEAGRFTPVEIALERAP